MPNRTAAERAHAKLAPLIARGATTDELVAALLTMPADERDAARESIIRASVAEDGAEATAEQIRLIASTLNVTRH